MCGIGPRQHVAKPGSQTTSSVRATRLHTIAARTVAVEIIFEA